MLVRSLIDRFLAVERVDRGSLQLLGLVALRAAIRLEEGDDQAALCDQCGSVDRGCGYTANQANAMTKRVDRFLDRSALPLAMPSPITFHQRLCDVAGVERGSRSDLLVHCLLDLSLLTYTMQWRPPLIVAAAALHVALDKTLQPQAAWTAELEKHTGLSAAALRPCVAELLAVIEPPQGAESLGEPYKEVRADHGVSNDPSSGALVFTPSRSVARRPFGLGPVFR